ncbi:MAG: BMP family ABC transporter substrate-binding protein [Oscillospiraceae bacterium]|nr:BMP family ABC transporter substrate-binding protein [Oscillospiraceae bacterium]
MKKSICLVLAIALAAVLAACGGGTAGTPAAPDTAGASVRVLLNVTTSGIGDLGFNDLAHQGIQDAAASFGIQFDVTEPRQMSDHEVILAESAASGDYDLIIAVGFEQIEALRVVAEDYPEQKFMMLDAIVEAPNVVSYVSHEHEASFLIGALAALAHQYQISPLINDTPVLGFIGGVDSPMIGRFLSGYMAGARYVNSDLEVIFDFVGGFGDPGTATAIADTMHHRGASIIYPAAGGSGLGLFTSAQENGFVAFGVNTNQNSIAPDFIMASMLKLVDRAVYDAVRNIVEGTFQAGTITLGLAEGAVGYSVEGSNIEVPQHILDTVDAIKDDVVSGAIVVPDAVDQVEAFLASHSFAG